MPDCSEEADSTADDIRQRMTGDDRAQWDAIQEWKDAQISPRRPRVITQRIRSFVLAPLKKTVDLARKVPGGAAIADKTSSAVLGLVEKTTSAAESSVPRKRIVRAYRRAGNDVECLEDIRNLNGEQRVRDGRVGRGSPRSGHRFGAWPRRDHGGNRPRYCDVLGLLCAPRVAHGRVLRV